MSGGDLGREARGVAVAYVAAPCIYVTIFKMTTKRAHQFYCGRGDAENRIKELKQGLELGRTGCSSFMANQLRVQLTLATFVLLMQELAIQTRHTAYCNAQVNRLRDRLLDLPVWVEESVRRIVLHLPNTLMARADWQRVALAVGGASPWSPHRLRE